MLFFFFLEIIGFTHSQRHYTNTVVCNVAMHYVLDLIFHARSHTSTFYTLCPSSGTDSLVSLRSHTLCVEVWTHKGRGTTLCMAGAKCWALHVAEVWILRSSGRVSRSIVNATEFFRKDYSRVMHWLSNSHILKGFPDLNKRATGVGV